MKRHGHARGDRKLACKPRASRPGHSFSRVQEMYALIPSRLPQGCRAVRKNGASITRTRSNNYNMHERNLILITQCSRTMRFYFSSYSRASTVLDRKPLLAVCKLNVFSFKMKLDLKLKKRLRFLICLFRGTVSQIVYN